MRAYDTRQPPDAGRRGERALAAADVSEFDGNIPRNFDSSLWACSVPRNGGSRVMLLMAVNDRSCAAAGYVRRNIARTEVASRNGKFNRASGRGHHEGGPSSVRLDCYLQISPM